MSEEQFEAMVEMIKAIVAEAINDARPLHDRRCKTEGVEFAIEQARMLLVVNAVADREQAQYFGVKKL